MSDSDPEEDEVVNEILQAVFPLPSAPQPPQERVPVPPAIMPPQLSSSLTSAADVTASPAVVEQFFAALKTLEEDRQKADFNPVPHLNSLSELLEKEMDTFYGLDPDPYDDRHPSRIFPACGFGMLLKLFFKKEQMVQDLFSLYLKENYWRIAPRYEPERDAFDVNVAASRLALGVLPGLQPSVLYDSAQNVGKFFDWAERAKEPLRSYATGLLALAMEQTEVATDPDNREKNSRLVPIMLQRLRALKEETSGQPPQPGDAAPATASTVDQRGRSFKRPFAVFANSDVNNKKEDNSGGRRKRRRSSPGNNDPNPSSSKSAKISKPASLLPPLAPARRPSFEQPNLNDSSNSSWAEMEPQIIGHFPIHPLTEAAKQIFIIKLLTPLAEYQEFLAHSHDQGLREMLHYYVDLRCTGEARLAFEATKCLAALFVHKKFALEWVTSGGVESLLKVPRPSMASTAVTQCLYFIACDNDIMEKVCAMPRHVLIKLVRYILWCMQCSHETGRAFAVMFFGVASSYRVFVDLFDEQDGLRSLYNSISVLKILQVDDEASLMTDDEEATQKQALRQATVSFRKYFEAHLIIRCEHLSRLRDRSLQSHHSSSSSSSSSSSTAAASSSSVRSHRSQSRLVPQGSMWDMIDVVVKLVPFRARWAPVDKFEQLGGIATCLKIIAMAYDWTFQGRSEMVRCSLDTLAICSVMPKVQLSFCDKIRLYDETNIGIHIILSAAEGEIVQDSAEVRKSALGLIINCVSAPIDRNAGSVLVSRAATATPPVGASRTPSSSSSSKKKMQPTRHSEDLINKMWNCVRSNNGILVLLELIHIKTPITDADSIRALACKALAGLVRSRQAKQIMSKLPIFTNGQLQQLVREPILLDQRIEHVKFQQYAYDLMTMVSQADDDGTRRLRGPTHGDFSLQTLHRSSIVAQTDIRFSKKQLLQLIQEYLSANGLSQSAHVLQREANLTIMTSSARSIMHQTSSSGPLQAMQTPTRTNPSQAVSPVAAARCGSAGSVIPCGPGSVSRVLVSPQAAGGAAAASRPRPNTPPTSAVDATTPTPSTPSSNTPIVVRHVNRSRIVSDFTSSGGSVQVALNLNGTPRSTRDHSHGGTSQVQKSCDARGAAQELGDPLAPCDGDEVPRASLLSIVSDYLSTQHSLCRNPMTTCPEFDLFIPHKCPDPRPKSSAPLNISSRFARRSSARPPFGGSDGRRLDRKYVYSRFRPVKTYRVDANEGSEQESTQFTSCAIMPDDSFILAGTYQGDVKLFNINSGAEEAAYACHESAVYNLQPNKDCSLLLTSSRWRTPYSGLWSLGEFFESKMVFQDDDYVEFSKQRQDKVIGTRNDKCTIYDLTGLSKVRELKSSGSNMYSLNKATFNPTDDLVLNDGVLYDMRVAKEIHKFDKLNQTLSGVFHPNGMEVVSNSEVWDLRTFHLLKTVVSLDQCEVVFANSGEVMYAISLEVEDEDGDKYESAFKTLDASDYSSIATFETRRSVVDLCTSEYDLQIAVVENSLHPNPAVSEESVVRLYDVGRLRAEDIEDVDGEDEDDVDDERDDNEDDDDGDDTVINGSDEDDDEDFLLDVVGTDSEGEDEDADDDDDDDQGDGSGGDGDEQGEESSGDDDDDGNDDDDGDNEEAAGSDASWDDLEREEVIG